MFEEKLTGVYLAGKIGKNDWRHDIFLDLRNAESNTFEIDIVDSCKYVGPFFVGCDHGCFHGDTTHGRGIGKETCTGNHSKKNEDMMRTQLVKQCHNWIQSADFIFCWIDSATAFGTLVEIGMAYSLNIPIFMVGDIELKNMNFMQELWFARYAATQMIYAESAHKGWESFVQWKDRHDNGGARVNTDYATTKQIKYINSLMKQHDRKFKEDINPKSLSNHQVAELISYFVEGKDLDNKFEDLLERRIDT